MLFAAAATAPGMIAAGKDEERCESCEEEGGERCGLIGRRGREGV